MLGKIFDFIESFSVLVRTRIVYAIIAVAFIVAFCIASAHCVFVEAIFIAFVIAAVAWLGSSFLLLLSEWFVPYQ